MGAPGALDGPAVDLRGSGPALRCAQHDHRPADPLGRALLAGRALHQGDAVQGPVEGLGQGTVDLVRVVAGDVEWFMAVSAQQLVEFGLRDAGQHRRVGDLVAVEVEDGEHGTVVDRVEELVRVPGGGERAGLRLAVADHTGDEQVRIVEGRAVRVSERVAELTALVDRAGRLRRDMTRHSAGERELPEQLPHARGVTGDVRVGLAVAALEPGVGQHGRPAVPRAPHAQRVQIAGLDDAVEMGVDEVEAGRGPQWPSSLGLMCAGLRGSVSSALASR